MSEKNIGNNNINNNNNSNKNNKENTFLKGYSVSAKSTYFKLLEDEYFSKRNDWVKVDAKTAPIGNDLLSTIGLCVGNNDGIDKSKIPLLFTNLSIESNEKLTAIRGPYFLDESNKSSTNDGVRMIRYNSIIRNAIPNYQIMTDKYLLYKCLYLGKSTYSVPSLFINRGRIELGDYQALVDSNIMINGGGNDEDTLWYLKDPLLNRSKGIHLFKSIDQAIEFTKQPENNGNRYLLQKEVVPMLLDGLYKFDIRVFLVTTFTSDGNVLVYMFNDGIVRSTNSKYKKGNLNKESQLTNFCFQLEISATPGEFIRILPLSQYDDMDHSIFNSLVNASRNIFSMFINKLNTALPSDGFSLLGLDFILDQNKHPHLLEINISPSTFQQSPTPVKQICQNLISQLPAITFDKLLNTTSNKQATDFIQILTKK